MYLAWRPFSLKTTKQKGAWQRTSFKGWSTHILWLHSLLYLYFNPEIMRGMTVLTQNQRRGQADDQVMSFSLKESMFTLYLTSCIWRGGLFVEDDDSRKGRGKGLPLKVGQHIYCAGILYYTYIFNPRGNERNDSTTQSKTEEVQEQRSGYELVLKKSLCLLCILLHVFGVEALSLKTTKQKGAWRKVFL